MFNSIIKAALRPVAIMADHTIGTIAKPIAAITDNEKNWTSWQINVLNLTTSLKLTMKETSNMKLENFKALPMREVKYFKRQPSPLSSR